MTNGIQKPKVLWLINIPSPYRVDFFETLGSAVDLTVVFEKSMSDERDKSWEQSSFSNFRGIVLGGLKVKTDSAFSFEILKYLKDAHRYDAVVVSNPMSMNGMLSILYLKSRGIPFSIETDGGFPKNGKGFRERLKHGMISSASVWLSTAQIHDAYYLAYGAKAEKIYRYPFTSVWEKDVLAAVLSDRQKQEWKRKLGISEEKVVLAVGQFIHRKGFDTLLRAAVGLDDRTAVVLLGGEETDVYRGIRLEADLKHIYYPGFISRDRIKAYYLAADVLVLPTREDIWGLVINEALAFGLPVITTDMCIAGTELVKDGVNGYLIHAEDEKSLADRLDAILSDSDLCRRMGENSLEIAKKYTIEEMVKWHEYFFKQTVSQRAP